MSDESSSGAPDPQPRPDPSAGTPDAAPREAAPVPAPEPMTARQGVRGITVGLAILLLFVATLAPRLPGPDRLEHVQARPPEPVQPTGELAEAYGLARPATLRIEARCAGAFRGGAIGVGSGFYATPEGGVITAYHVVEGDGGARCPVRYVGVEADGDEVPLELVGFDAYFDLAWMQAATDGEVPYLPLAERAPRPGTEVVAIGNSRGDVLAPRAGRVTRLGVRANRADFADGTIELTAALAPGDSGGPVVTAAGEAVGVVSFISFTPGSLQSDAYVPPFLRGLSLPSRFASYAVPVTAEGEMVSALRAGERRDVPVIGFSWRPGFDYEPGGDLEFGMRPGPIVVDVAPGGPAEQAGLRSYEEKPVYGEDGELTGIERRADVIVAVDGEPTPTFYALLETIRRKEIGEPVRLTVQRGRTTVRLELVLGAKREVFAAQ
jgi:S1-C subfamily serine protease